MKFDIIKWLDTATFKQLADPKELAAYIAKLAYAQGLKDALVAQPLRELSVEQACVLWHESNQDIYVYAKAILAAARS